MPLRLLQVGLGPIGLGTVARCLDRGDMNVIAAIDPMPQKAGRQLSELLDAASLAVSEDALIRAQSVKVYASVADALRHLGAVPDVAIHTTSSFLEVVTDQLIELAGKGINVVSTCEELSFPWWHHPKEAQAIDRVAKQMNVSVLGTGVNPGFAMDLLPLFLSGVSASVESISAHRVVDAGKRRGPLQKKVGAGITVEEFAQRKATGRFGHVGLPESIAMIGHALGWKLATIESELRPKIADAAISTEHVHIEAGHVLGIDQIGFGRDVSGKERIRLHLEMYVGASDPADSVRLQGSPPLDLKVAGGIPGDIASVASLINVLPRIVAAPAGVLTMLDLPIPKWNPCQTDNVTPG